RRVALLRALQQRAARRIARVGREVEVGVRAGAAHDLVQALELAHRLRELTRRVAADLALVLLGAARRELLRLVEEGVDAGLPAAVDERIEIPGGRLKLGI